MDHHNPLEKAYEIHTLAGKLQADVHEFSRNTRVFVSLNWRKQDQYAPIELRTFRYIKWTAVSMKEIVEANPINIARWLVQTSGSFSGPEVDDAFKVYERQMARRKARLALDGDPAVKRVIVLKEGGPVGSENDLMQMVEYVDSINTDLATLALFAPPKDNPAKKDLQPYVHDVQTLSTDRERLDHTRCSLLDSIAKLNFIANLSQRDMLAMWANRLRPEDHEIKEAMLDIVRLVFEHTNPKS